MTPTPTNNNNMITIDGHFNPNDIEDETNPYPRPLYLLPLPSLVPSVNDDNDKSVSTKEKNDDDGARGEDDDTLQLLAYGGDDGRIFLLPSSSTNNSTGTKKKPKVIQRYDDEVRAVAVSPNGRRIAVGFDDGSIKMYNYDNWTPPPPTTTDDEQPQQRARHPFAESKSSRRNNNDDEEDEEQDDLFMTQGDDDDENNAGVVMYDGPRLDAPIRHLQFDPRSGSNGFDYYLAIASESGNSPLVIVNVTTDTSESTSSRKQKQYLAEQSADEHRGGGVRHVAYSFNTAMGVNATNGESVLLLTSLGMDGRLVTWDVTSKNPHNIEWDVVKGDVVPSIPKPDLGIPIADSSDKACKHIWDAQLYNNKSNSNAVLYIPGREGMQYRIVPVSESLKLERERSLGCCPKFIVDGSGQNIDTIVVIAVEPTTNDNNNSTAKRRIITGCKDGRVFLWEIDLNEGAGGVTEISVNRPRSNDSSLKFGISPVTDIVWESKDEICVAFADGTVATADSIDVDGLTKNSKGKEPKTIQTKEILSVKKGSNNETIDDDSKQENETFESEESHGEVPNFDDSDEEDVATTDEPRSKSSTVSNNSASSKKTGSASKFIEDEADEGGEDDDDEEDVQYDDVVVTPAKTNDVANDDTNDEDDVDMDFGGDDDIAFQSHNDPVDNRREDDARYNDVAAYDPGLALQSAFAPSSTPLIEPRRIICWNQIGLVTLRPDDADGTGDSNNNLVDIAFHETAGLSGGRRPVTFTDNLGFIVGTLGEEGAMFATDLVDEDDDDNEDDEDFSGLGVLSRKALKLSKKKKINGGSGGSLVYFHRFETFGRNVDKDWVMALPDGERVLGCATGGGWGAVITSRRFLRLFTVSGMQGPVLWIPGEPVTVVGRQRFVAVFYHRSTAPMKDGTQLLNYAIFDGITGATVVTGDVAALSPGASLTWVGFNENCALSVMDSEGMFSMLARYPGASNSSNGNWMPLLDTVGHKRSTNDVFWPVEIHGGKLVCVLLRGGREYPDAMRRPVTTTLNLRIPMATTLTAKSGPFEECSVRAIFALNQEKVVNDYLVTHGEENEEEMEELYNESCNRVDKVTLKLFHTVVQAGKVERAFDLVQRLHTEKAMDLAIQVADRLGHRKLSDRIEEMKLQKYPPIDVYDEGKPFDDSISFDSGRRNARSGSFDEETDMVTRQQQLGYSQKISPDGGGLFTPCQQTRSYSTDEESPPNDSLKRKIELDNAPVVSKKRINPFAKKAMESPAKELMKVVGSPSKPKLSRSSTFSTQSRQKQRSGKHIV